MRVCLNCNESKPAEEFVTASKGRERRKQVCNSCVRAAGLLYRHKNKERIRERNARWYRQNTERVREYRRSYEATAKGIWVRIKSHKRTGPHAFELSEASFLEWLKEQPSRCHYCNLDLNEVELALGVLGIARVPKRLQVDRKNSAKGYAIGNIVLACPICNYHKSSFFSYEDFRTIAKDVLAPKLQKLVAHARTAKQGE